MKRIPFIICFLLISFFASAEHLKGGFFTYRYLGQGSSPTKLRYQVTLTVYMICNPSSGQLTQSIPFTFFNAATGQQVQKVYVSISQQYQLSRVEDEECITGEQRGCYYYIVIYDLPEIELDANGAGYAVSYQRCCRIIDIKNIGGASNTLGNTYGVQIPGSNAGQNAQQNSSASFQINDTTVVCKNSFFQYPFLATDPDGDSLSYYFCDAWTGGGQGGGSGPGSAAPDPAAAPLSFNPLQYQPVPYGNGFSGASPLGPGVTINSRTGLISGIAPATEGQYVITVCVNEYRNGVLIATNRKELHVTVGDCNEIEALPGVFDINGIRVEPNGASCKSFSFTFNNLVPDNPLITSYYWEISDGATYTVKNPSHTFTSDTGLYSIKLVVNRGQKCSDSATTTVRVYPGFFTGFTHTGVCVNKTTSFTDTSSTRYGVVNSWRWDFGETGTNADTSRLRNPTFTYPTDGTKNITFIVANSMGCVDTVRKPIDILTRPPLSVAFKDTLICTGDSVQLEAIGQGLFSWTPAAAIINANTATPIVHPSATTNYIVQLDDQGCLATDTVQVRVVNFVTLQAMADTVICEGDSLHLRATTDGLRYEWTDPATVSDPALLNPMARPANNPTVYTITSRIGPRCFARDDVEVRLVPYAVVNAGFDTTICFNTPASLNGFTNGTLIGWLPKIGLSDPVSLNPTASPKATTAYTLSATNSLGCITRDTVIVTVNPEVIAFAGRDTAVVVGQTLQFNATGGQSYFWSPPTALSGIDIPNPKATYNGSFDSIRYTLVVGDSIGCTDEASVLVKIFRTSPRVFVPTAFTPNGDGKNEIVAPIAVGLTKLDYFRIYNRWGQLVFQTTINGKGWDGKISGKEQGTSTYVWIVKGTDYTGKVVFEKGTVTLIR